MPIIKSEIQALVDEGVEVHPDRRAALQLLHRPEVARLRPGRDGRRSRARRWTRRSASDNACLDGVTARRRRRWPSTSAAATTAASGTPRAATTRSPRSCSPSSTSTPSCSSTSPSAPARSSRCASCRADKTVVLGLVSSKLPELESPDRAAPADRRGEPVRAAREPGAQPPVRLRVGDGRQSADRGGAVAQDAARRRRPHARSGATREPQRPHSLGTHRRRRVPRRSLGDGRIFSAALHRHAGGRPGDGQADETPRLRRRHRRLVRHGVPLHALAAGVSNRGLSCTECLSGWWPYFCS